MKLSLKDRKDIIIYSCGDIIATNKDKLKNNLELNEHYQGKPINKEITASVLEVEEVFNNLMRKLSKEEKFLLNNLCRIS